MPGPRIPELEKCICGCSLKMGSKIIAATFFILCSFLFIASFGKVFVTEYQDSTSTDKSANSRPYTQSIIEFVLMAVLSGLLSTLSGLLWYGIEKHRASYVLPWCILTTAFNAIFTISIMTSFIVHFISLYQVISLLVIGAIYYAILIVYSHFRELRREKNTPTTFNNAE